MKLARASCLVLVASLACRSPRPEVTPDDATARPPERSRAPDPAPPDAATAPDAAPATTDADVDAGEPFEEVTLAQVLRSHAYGMVRDPARLAAAFDPADYARTPAVEARDELPHAALVPLPPLAPPLAAQAQALRGDALRAFRCFTSFARASHPAVPECPAVAERLVAGGAAAVHAIGRAAYDVQMGRLSPEEVRLTAAWGTDGFSRVITFGNSRAAAEFVTAVLRRIDDPAAVPYVLDLLVRPLAPDVLDTGHGDSDALRLWFELLPALTGQDLSPMAPWARPDNQELQRFMAHRLPLWLRWYRAHQAEDRAAWRAQGLAAARPLAADPRGLPGMAAVLRLGARGNADADRAVAAAGLARILASPRLGAVGRRWMLRWAAAEGLPAGDAGAP